jgi:hypothetical protein
MGRKEPQTMKSPLLLLASALIALLGAFPPAAPASHASPRTPVSCSNQQFHFSQEIVIVTTKDNRLLKAAGQDWQLLTPPAVEYAVKVTPGGAIYLYETSRMGLNNRIYRSTDGGTTWQLSGHTPPNGSMTYYYHVWPSPVSDLLFLGVAYYPYDGGLLRSTDGGVVWQPVQGVGRAGEVVYSPDFARDGLAFATDLWRFWYGVRKTVNWGQTWTSVWDDIEANQGRVIIAFSPQFAEDRTAFSDIVHGPATAPGLYKTTDGGATWFKINALAVDGPPAFSPDYGRDQTFIVGQGQNLALSQDGGRTLTPIWDRANGSAVVWGARQQDPPDQPPAPPVPLPAAHPYYLPLMLGGPPPLEFWLVAQEAASGDCYLYRSRDNGASWQEIAVP